MFAWWVGRMKLKSAPADRDVMLISPPPDSAAVGVAYMFSVGLFEIAQVRTRWLFILDNNPCAVTVWENRSLRAAQSLDCGRTSPTLLVLIQTGNNRAIDDKQKTTLTTRTKWEQIIWEAIEISTLSGNETLRCNLIHLVRFLHPGKVCWPSSPFLCYHLLHIHWIRYTHFSHGK